MTFATQRSAFIALALGAVALAVQDRAQAAPPQAAMPEDGRLQIMSPDDIRPEQLLPPPPTDGSAAQLAEIEAIKAVQRRSSPERRAQAAWDDRHEDVGLFRPNLGPGFDLTAMPATAKLLSITAHDAAYAAGLAKVYFARRRPWAYDPAITDCEKVEGKPIPLRSYPSGHATLSFSTGVVLAKLRPDLAQPILLRAQDFAVSRVVCGVHYPSDVVASQVLGMAIAFKVLHDPRLADLRAQAAKEMQSASLVVQLHPYFPPD